MTVRVVRGLVNPVDSTSAQLNNTNKSSQAADTAKTTNTPSVTQQSLNQASTQASVQVANQLVSSDAVVTNIKATKSNQSSEKIRDIKEARSVAKNAADKITSFGKASLDAHTGLDSASAQAVL